MSSSSSIFNIYQSINNIRIQQLSQSDKQKLEKLCHKKSQLQSQLQSQLPPAPSNNISSSSSISNEYKKLQSLLPPAPSFSSSNKNNSRQYERYKFNPNNNRYNSQILPFLVIFIYQLENYLYDANFKNEIHKTNRREDIRDSLENKIYRYKGLNLPLKYNSNFVFNINKNKIDSWIKQNSEIYNNYKSYFDAIIDYYSQENNNYYSDIINILNRIKNHIETTKNSILQQMKRRIENL